MEKRWTIIAILFLVQIVNFADKTVVGLAAVSIMQELNLSASQYGLVASSFYSLYAVTTLVVALVFAPRYTPRVILTGLLLVWSVAQLPILIVASLGVLIGCRTVLGAAEGPGTPTVISAAHEWFPPEERTLPTALVMLGTTVGPLLAAPLLSLVIASWGWRAAFLMCSLLGFLALILWWSLGADGPGVAVSDSRTNTAQGEDKSPQKLIWTDPTIIGWLLCGFCAYWSIGFSVSWLAPFLRVGLGFDTMTVGWAISLIFLGNGIIGLIASSISQRLTLSGVSSRGARGIFIAVAQFGSAIFFVATAYASSDILKVVCIMFAISLPAITYTVGPPIISEITRPADRNRTMGIIMAIIPISGIIAPYASGKMVESQPGIAGYDAALILAAAALALGGTIALFTLHPERSKARLVSAD
ncbi:MAG: MFS transporter [Sphingomonadaceae bacterium]